MENIEYVQRGFRILNASLSGYIAREMSREYKDKWWDVILFTLGDNADDLPRGGTFAELVDSLDVANCIRLIQWRWAELFKKLMPRDCKTWATELMGFRNKVAHAGSSDMSQDDAERALDTMARLCADSDPDASEDIRKLLRTLRYGTENGSTSKTDGNNPAPPAKPKQTAAVLQDGNSEMLPSWRDVIEPHPDVAQGRYLNAEFAADLAQVARGEGAMEYVDPVEFFARTYVTEGMKGLLVQAIKRFTGRDGEPVLQLKTSFGGGKTHSLLALFHMAKCHLSPDKLPNLRETLDEAGIDVLPDAKVAVLVGTALEPARSRRPANLPGVTINTLWGEMAAQLAIAANKPELYDYVKESDKKGVSPGSIALKQLFDDCGPCLILMDELVAYAKKLYGVDGLPAGSFENFISFIQEITEAASASRNSMVVASIPESNVEIGGEGGKKALEAIEHTFGRKESIWKPVAANEGFEVVRRRLFLDCKDTAKRDQVCAAFSRMYQTNSGDFPIAAKEVDYQNRMKACYPIHPEVFDRLYEEWATLEKFQRTRGVLRLMAAVIHELWMANDAAAMIMPGSLTLDMPNVREELIRYLPNPETWNAVFDSEIDGKNSQPYRLDKNNQRYGKRMAARRVSRTIMLGSAPTVRAQSIRGIEASRIRLGIVQPGESIADFNDALSNLRNSLTYLYSDSAGNRYWYDTRPTLRKTASDRSSQMAASDVEYEIEKRLREFRKESPFSALHICPSSSSDVSDEQSLRLVVLKPSDTYNKGIRENNAIKRADEILNTRGNSPRTYRNMLVFVAADNEKMNDLDRAVRDLLAWQSIKKDSASLNLDAAQNAETKENIEKCDKAVALRVQEAFCWMLVPEIDNKSDKKMIIWNTVYISGNNPVISKAAAKLIQDGQAITKWAPTLLKMELDEILWCENDHIQVKKLWDYLTTYCYLSRLRDYSVLEETIRAGVEGEDCFAIASSFDGTRYSNLRYNQSIPAVFPEDYLVKTSCALKQIYRDNQAETKSPVIPTGAGSPIPPSFGDNGYTSKPVPGPEPQSPQEPKNTRFFMSVTLDNTRIIRDLQKYLEEVITHLSENESCNVELTLEVNAHSAEGFSQGTVRTVSENCRTLRVENFGFEN